MEYGISEANKSFHKILTVTVEIFQENVSEIYDDTGSNKSITFSRGWIYRFSKRK